MVPCARCRRLLATGAPRYVVRIEVYAAAGPLEVDAAELDRDHAAELDRLRTELAGLSPEEAEDGVYRAFDFIICRPCQRVYLRDPLGSSR